MVAGFIPEQWPASNRNPWPTSVGIISVAAQIHPAGEFLRLQAAHGMDDNLSAADNGSPKRV
jgi:hypothetical protein